MHRSHHLSEYRVPFSSKKVTICQRSDIFVYICNWFLLYIHRDVVIVKEMCHQPLHLRRKKSSWTIIRKIFIRISNYAEVIMMITHMADITPTKIVSTARTNWNISTKNDKKTTKKTTVKGQHRIVGRSFAIKQLCCLLHLMIIRQISFETVCDSKHPLQKCILSTVISCMQCIHMEWTMNSRNVTKGPKTNESNE